MTAWLQRGLAALGMVLLVALAVLLVLLATEGGSRWLLGQASDLAGSRLTIDGVRGTLLGGVMAERLVITTPALDVTVTDARLGLRWPVLLRRRVSLDVAAAGQVHLVVHPRDDPAPAEVGRRVLLPVPLSVTDLAIGRLTVATGADTPVALTNLRVTGDYVAGVARLESVAATLYGIDVAAAGYFDTARPYPLAADVRWSIDAAGVTGSGTVEGSLAALTFRQQVKVPEPADVAGTLRLLDAEPRLEATARWPVIARKVPGIGAVVSRGGRLRAAGWLSAFQAELVTGLTVADAPPGQVHVRVAGDRERLQVPALRVTALDGTVSGSGTLDLTGVVAGAFQLQGRQLDPRYIDPRFPGRLDVDASMAFNAAGDFSVDAARLAGVLYGRPFAASGRLARREGELYLQGLQVNAGDNRLQAEGRWGRQLAGSFRIDAPHLPTLWPDLRGELQGTGRLGGTLARPTFSADLQGTGVGFGDPHVDSLSIEGGIARGERIDLGVTLRGLAWGERVIGDVDATVDGTLAGHRFGLDLRSADGSVSLGGTGRWLAGAWQGRLGRGRVAVRDLPEWTLRDEPAFRLAAGRVALDPHCWAAGTPTLCLAEFRLQAGDLQGGGTLREFPLAGLGPRIDPDLALDGMVNAEVQVRRAQGQITGSLRFAPRDVAVRWRPPGEEVLETRFEEFMLAAEATEGQVTWQAGIAESFGIHLRSLGRITAPFGPDPQIDGTVSGGIPDLSRLSPVVERFFDTGDLQGEVTLDAAFSGDTRRPRITGGLRLADGAFAVPVAGITVDRIRLELSGAADGTAQISGGARSGGGFVQLGGRLTWQDALMPAGELTIRGRVFEVIRLPEGVVQVSPDVQVRLIGGQFRVGGRVHVPRADITLEQLGDGAVSPSPDTVVHGREEAGEEAERPVLFVLDGLQVQLGNDVSFTGFGLVTGLTGQVVLNQGIGADPSLVTGEGVVQVTEGSFTALGQTLEIDRGALIFSGVVTDPAIDVRASREVTWEGRDVTVGLLLSGTLSGIQTRVFSEPAMGEMDALAYLTTGRPLEAAGAGDQFSIANAAMTLGLRGAMPLTERLGAALSVDEFGIQGGAEGTSFVIGEQLGSDLFIRYSYGIFNQIGTIRATYRLNRRVSLEASSGEEQALDLIYSVTW